MQLKSTVNVAMAVGLAVTLALSVPPRLSADDPRGDAHVSDGLEP